LLYSHLIEGSSVPFFRCDRLFATISVDQCSSMWRAANQRNSEVRRQCRGCVLGAQHAGQPDANLCDIHGVKICARCRDEATRLIWGNLCVSCQNRQYEFIRGRNARGKPLLKLSPLEPRQVTFQEGSTVRYYRSALSSSMDELVVSTLRDAMKRVAFGFMGFAQRAGLRQQRLF
jgi:hypothetical protein